MHESLKKTLDSITIEFEKNAKVKILLILKGACRNGEEDNQIIHTVYFIVQ
jgi:hypothetical protein